MEDKKQQEAIKKFALQMIKDIQPDVDERKPIYQRRRNMFEGRQEIYTNVVGLQQKDVEGHIMPVFNYVKKMAKKLYQSVTNYPFRYRIEGEDESNEIELGRSEAAEKFIDKVLYDNKFYNVIFKRGTLTQLRDGDAAIKCVVEDNNAGGRDIKMYLCEQMENMYVLWDDVQGTSFSALAYVKEWSNERIRREYPQVKLEETRSSPTSSIGSHDNDQFGLFSSPANTLSPTGLSKVPKTKVADAWVWAAFDKDASGNPIYKIANVVLIGTGEDAEIAEFQVTDYRRMPWVFVHGEANPGKPWSSAFIDILFDANIELNDRSGEEADVIRIGANEKFVIKNMPDFDAESLKPGSGQGIYIDGPDADFYPLAHPINTFPSESYKNSMLDHLFNLGLPKIALSAGAAPYTGRVGAIQYQAVADEVTDLRCSWNNTLQELFTMIQEYGIDFFPDAKDIFTISEEVAPGMYEDGATAPRKVSFDWDNPLPLSRSDAVVDAATMFDRKVLPTRMFLEQAGFKDPNRIVKELKKEWKDEDLVPIRSQYENLADSVIKKQDEATREMAETEQEIAATVAATAAVSTPASTSGSAGGTTPPPMMHNFQNQGRSRGISSSPGSPATGAKSAGGAMRQRQQNRNAARGV
jgi:hypothetical protein